MARIQTKKFGSAVVTVAENIGTGDNTELIFTDTLINLPVIPGTVTVNWTDGTAKSAVDNGFGVLSGSGLTSGTINYLTGVVNLSFTTAPDNTTAVTCTYSSARVGPFQVTSGSTGVTGVSSVSTYEGFLPNSKVIPKSVTFSINFSAAPVTFTDDGTGKLSGNNLSTGFINYFDGNFKLYFSTPPDAEAALTCTYKHRHTEDHEQVILPLVDDANVISIQPSYSTPIMGALYSSSDEVTYTPVDSFYIPTGGSAKIFAVHTNKAYRLVSANHTIEVVTSMV
jgi:hypothetical protein